MRILCNVFHFQMNINASKTWDKNSVGGQLALEWFLPTVSCACNEWLVVIFVFTTKNINCG